MPCERDPNIKMSYWDVLKQNIGRDLTKITMPVYFNEPLSILQKQVEVIEYLEILKKANNADNQHLRMAYSISAFFIMMSNVIGRVKKPFNPLKGETYEYIEDDLRVVVE